MGKLCEVSLCLLWLQRLCHLASFFSALSQFVIESFVFIVSLYFMQNRVSCNCLFDIQSMTRDLLNIQWGVAAFLDRCLGRNHGQATSQPLTESLCLQVNSARDLKAKLEAAGKSLVPLVAGNLVDKIWGSDRPAPPSAGIRVHKLEYAGQKPSEKIQDLRQKLQGNVVHLALLPL